MLLGTVYLVDTAPNLPRLIFQPYGNPAAQPGRHDASISPRLDQGVGSFHGEHLQTLRKAHDSRLEGGAGQREAGAAAGVRAEHTA